MLRRINLIPAADRPRTQSDAGMLAIIVLAIIVLAGIAFSYVYFNAILSDRQRELADVQAETARVQGQLTALAQYEQLQEQRQKAEDVVQHIYAGRTLVSQTLGDLSLVIPEDSWLQTLQLTAPAMPPLEAGAQSVEITAGSLSVEGRTYTFEDVAKTMVRFEQIPALERVVLGEAGEDSDSAASTKTIKRFTFAAELINTQPVDTPLPLSQVQVAP